MVVLRCTCNTVVNRITICINRSTIHRGNHNRSYSSSSSSSSSSNHIRLNHNLTIYLFRHSNSNKSNNNLYHLNHLINLFNNHNNRCNNLIFMSISISHINNQLVFYRINSLLRIRRVRKCYLIIQCMIMNIEIRVWRLNRLLFY